MLLCAPKMNSFHIIEVGKLKECLSTLMHEQQQLCGHAASSTLSAVELQHRLLVLERYFVALARRQPTNDAKSVTRKSMHSIDNLTIQKR